MVISCPDIKSGNEWLWRPSNIEARWLWWPSRFNFTWWHCHLDSIFDGLIPSNIEFENDGQDDAMEGEQWKWGGRRKRGGGGEMAGGGTTIQMMTTMTTTMRWWRHGQQQWGSVDNNNEMGKRMIMEVRGGWRRWQDNDSTIKLRD